MSTVFVLFESTGVFRNFALTAEHKTDELIGGIWVELNRSLFDVEYTAGQQWPSLNTETGTVSWIAPPPHR
jgi:hypothetical protein